ncbi:MAG TPA: serine hydroxymethyltransferase [Candidatus Babeliales bacterium]|nr:serine hydroxymethyltransferase [Candidatus Babeliales bacterium]
MQIFGKDTFVDVEIAAIMAHESDRLEHEINLIASENYTSQAVMQATGSVLTNKYAEGYSGKRYYAGCQYVDAAETLAIERCKKLFNAEHANVQPHAGSQANMAAYFALLNPGDTILGMSLAEGGHLTHGHKVNFSGKIFNAIQYTVDPITGLLNYDDIQLLAEQHKPKLIVAGASAYSRTIDFARFGQIAQSVGAYLMADIAHIAGLVATGLHPHPFPHADIVTSTTHKTLRGPRGGLILCKKELAEKVDKSIMPGMQGGPFMHVIAAKAVAFYEALQPEFKNYQKQILKNAHAMATEFINLGYTIVTGGTDNHLFVLDLRSAGLTGLQAEQALAKAGITVSKSGIPFDPQKPWITSGIRIGTPAITTRGMQEAQAIEIAHLIHECIKHHATDAVLKAVRQKAAHLCAAYPIYTETAPYTAARFIASSLETV